MTAYNPKDKNLHDLIDYSINEMIKSRAIHTDTDAKKINASRVNFRDQRISKTLLKEFDRRLSLDDKAGKSLGIEAYNRYMTYVRSCVREKGIKNPATVNKLLLATQKKATLTKPINKILSLDLNECKKELELLMSDVVKKSEQVKTKKAAQEWIEISKILHASIADIEPKFLLEFTRKKESKEKLESLKSDRIERYQNIDNDKIFNFGAVHKLCAEMLGVSPNAEIYRPETDVPSQKKIKCKNGIYALAFAVALATGRRSYEIVYLTDFKALSDKKMLITNVAKKSFADKDKSYEIDTLINAHAIEEAILRIRSSEIYRRLAQKLDECKYQKLHNKVFTDSMSRHLNEASRYIGKKLLTDKNGDFIEMKFKDARDLYIVCMHKAHQARGGKLKIDAFVKKNLLHTDLETALSYRKFESDDIVSKADVMRAERLEVRKKDRISKIKKFFASEEVQTRKPFIKCAKFCLNKLESDHDYVITTTDMRKIPQPDGKFKPLCKPAIIGEFVEMLKELELDLPA